MLLFYISAFALLALFVGTGIVIGSRGAGKKDYSLGGRKAGAAGVTGILLGALVGGAGSMILEWSFVSMGLRGAGTFFPFVLAVLKPGFLSPPWALASSIGGLVGMLLWAAAGLPQDPLFAGLAVSALCVAAGVALCKRNLPL